MIGTKGCLF